MATKEFKIQNLVPTPHNEAKLGDYADTMLMSGDPHRIKMMAKEFLTDAKLVNNVREAQAYTGYYKGTKLSVMAHGMGMPSMGIHAHELFGFYDVNNIIRMGSMGGFLPRLHPGDVVIVEATCTNSVYEENFDLHGSFSPCADFDLMRIAYDKSKELGTNATVGSVLTTDRFYNLNDNYRKWQHMGVLAVEMETASLYTNAAYHNKRALAINSISDSLIHTNEDFDASERETKFMDMIELGFETAIVADSLPTFPPYDAV